MRIRHALVFALLFLAVSARAAELAPPSSGAPESTVEQKAEMPVPSAGDTGSGGPEELSAFIRRDYERFGNLIRKAGIKPE